MNFRPARPVRRTRTNQPNIDQFFNEFFKNLDKGFPISTARPVVRKQVSVNVMEDNDAFQLQLAAPGFAKENFSLNVEKDILTIELKSEKKSEEGEKLEYKVREFYYTDFKKSFTLPETVDVDKISAVYENGILNVVLPKKEEAKPQPPRTIEIDKI
ncbi:MAG: Hsp20/alpha crystallin family protein [Saprospiraceae bacterium]